jgi:hypothetical protein
VSKKTKLWELSDRCISETPQIHQQGHWAQFGCVIDIQGPIPCSDGLFPPLCRGRLWNSLNSLFSGQLELPSLVNKAGV